MKRLLYVTSALLLLAPELSAAQTPNQPPPTTRPTPGAQRPVQPGHGNRPGTGRPQPSRPNPGRPNPSRPNPPRPNPGRPEIQPPRPGPTRPPGLRPNPTRPRPPHRPGAGRPPNFRPIHAPAFHYPHGYRYRRWSIGLLLPSLFLASRYYYDNYAALGVGPPPRGYRWVRYGPDLLLVDIRTRRIVDVIYRAFY
ncbi:MAG TPA: RcnB family protein [Sphingomonadaceae bacterium]|jgi:Ni/Co efflux regulator RcnB|nr:RcnB family protein [Sphingomonadaceae bacterium]